MSTAARSRRMFVFGVACATFGLLIGATSLLGWILDDDLLKGGFIAGITVKANTAICLFTLGLALLLLASERRPAALTGLGRGLAALVATVGAITLIEHLTGLSLGIDELVFHEREGALSTASPNRMGPPASMCFLLLGWAAIALDRREPRAGRTVSQVLAVSALVVCLIPLLGYVLSVHELYGVAQYTGIAFQTAFALTLHAFAVISLRPGAGFMANVLAEDPGGVLMRRLLPAAILLPVGIALLRIAGEQAGLYDRDFGRVLLVLLFIVLFCYLTFWTGAAVSSQDAARQVAVREREDSLRESDRRKNDFLATLAHELRNPLAPVRNAVELMRLKGTADPQQQWAQGMIERQVSHLARLIDDLMDVSRIERGKLELQRDRTSVGEIVAAVVDAGQPAVRDAGLTLTVSVVDEPMPLDADPVRLVQVFSNLLANAVKFTPRGGTIAIEAERRGPEAVVRIIDSGAGIAAPEQARLFEMFFQGAGPAGRAGGGLGIGLALVRHLVELHGGRVAAASAGEGQGSTFEVRLPLAMGVPAGTTPARAPGGKDDPHGNALRARRILVVDDNRDAAVSLGAILERAGATIAIAHDGDEAIALALSTAPDTILLDLGMPGKDGYAVAAEIRARSADGAPLLVALTGWGQEADRARSRSVGFDHHLVKPVSPEALLELLAGTS